MVHHYQCCASIQRQLQAHYRAVIRRERHKHYDYIVLIVPENSLGDPARVPEGVVSVHDGLGHAGGPRREYDSNDFVWAFTEHYTYPPARFLQDGRNKAAYYIMIRNGEVTGGDGAPEEALSLPGFHITARWAALCNQSGAFYGKEGGRRRSEDEAVMYAAIERYVGRENPLQRGGGPEIFWPPEVGGPLMAVAEEGNGLHNIAATMQMESPEFADYPITEMRVPIFDEMSEAQKKDFLALLHVST